LFGKLLWPTGLLTSLPVIDLHSINERKKYVAVCKSLMEVLDFHYIYIYLYIYIFIYIYIYIDLQYINIEEEMPIREVAIISAGHPDGVEPLSLAGPHSLHSTSKDDQE